VARRFSERVADRAMLGLSSTYLQTSGLLFSIEDLTDQLDLYVTTVSSAERKND